jgi:hypothetical protein
VISNHNSFQIFSLLKVLVATLFSRSNDMPKKGMRLVEQLAYLIRESAGVHLRSIEVFLEGFVRLQAASPASAMTC